MSLKTFRISIRHLVEFLLRSGDLKRKSSGLGDREAMQAGSRIHRKLQKRRGAAYHAEVVLQCEKEYPTFSLIVEGRADGIYTDQQGTVIEEIKGTYKDVQKMEEPDPVHLAQAKCYAYIYSTEHDLQEIRTELTYCHMETEEVKQFVELHSFEELEKWFTKLCDDYSKWAGFRVEWEKKRNESMEGMEFPFPYRDGQRDMVVSVYRTIQHQKQIFVQAPTGVGKTMSAIFPAVRAMGENLGEKIFYLTAKTITRTVAEEAFAILEEKGLQSKRVTITAKEKVCVCDKVNCDPRFCPRAKGHYDRINDAMYDLLLSENSCHREIILEYSEKWQVCPYEYQLDMAEFMDAVICDYNYAFDPSAKLGRFFGETSKKKDYILLIDEAHNLVERGREMFSADICKKEVLEVRRCIDKAEKKLRKALKDVNQILLEYQKRCTGCDQLEGISDLIIACMNLRIRMDDYLSRQNEHHPEEEDGQRRFADSITSQGFAQDGSQVMAQNDDQEDAQEKVLDFYFRLCAFLYVYELMDENYLTYMKLKSDGDLCVRLYCVNPARNLQYSLDRCCATAFFSATILPVKYYQGLLTTVEDNYAVYIESPFPQSNRMLAIATDVSSRYKRRGPEEYLRIATYIDQAVLARKGNYLVFFPSYQMMDEVYMMYEQNYLYQHEDRIVTLCQSPSMMEWQREEFLQAFTEPVEEDASIIGFCVMGGIFAEGIDLVGDALVGGLVVGTGLPQISKERELLKQFYDKQGLNGFDYAYKLPGMNKVMQAAGRVIRTVNDQGIILLMDERFGYQEYRRLFPKEWIDCQIVNVNSVGKKIEVFWNQMKGHDV